jgi:hypothetical protein
MSHFCLGVTWAQRLGTTKMAATLNNLFAEYQVVSASQCGLTGKRAATRFCGENPEGRSS